MDGKLAVKERERENAGLASFSFSHQLVSLLRAPHGEIKECTASASSDTGPLQY